MIIYKAENKLNGKVYIGQTIQSLSDRKARHLKDSEKNSPFVFHRAIKKYGADNFEWTVIQKCITMNHLNLAEQAYIELYKLKGVDLYNMTAGGLGSIGYKHTEEHKIKMSIFGMNRKHTEETKLKISNSKKGQCSRKGAVLSEEHKKKISEIHKGKTISQKQKEIISKAQKGRKHSEETKKKISEANKGNKNALGNSHNLGRKQSPETIKKRIETRKANKIKKGDKKCLIPEV